MTERARERMIENQEKIDALENERELELGTSLRERESEIHVQEIWFHSISCCRGSQNNDWSDYERIDNAWSLLPKELGMVLGLLDAK